MPPNPCCLNISFAHCVLGDACASHSEHVVARGHPEGVSPLLKLCGFCRPSTACFPYSQQVTRCICARRYRAGREGSPSALECVRWGISMICREVTWLMDSRAVGVASDAATHLRCSFTSSAMVSKCGAASYNSRPREAATEGSSQAPGHSEFLASWCDIVDPPSKY